MVVRQRAMICVKILDSFHVNGPLFAVTVLVTRQTKLIDISQYLGFLHGEAYVKHSSTMILYIIYLKTFTLQLKK